MEGRTSNPKARGTAYHLGFGGGGSGLRVYGIKPQEYKCLIGWILPPPSNSWIIIITWLYIALNRTPNIDCHWVGAVPNL